LNSDPTRGQGDGPSTDTDPGDSHSGEGLASVRPRLARTLADSAKRDHDKALEAIAASVLPEPLPNSKPEVPTA